MNRYLPISGTHAENLQHGWTMTVTHAGAFSDPADMGGAGADFAWHPAPVPGTAAEALHLAGLFDPANPSPLHDKDVWYRSRLTPARPGRHLLQFNGLATVAEVWLNGKPILSSTSMFAAHEVAVELCGPAELIICFRALAAHLAKKGPRARWRTQLTTSQGLRLIRTTLLGHMPGWCPEIHAVGPWRPVRLVRPGAVQVTEPRIQAALLEGGGGRLSVSVEISGNLREASLNCAGHSTAMIPLADGRYEATLDCPDIEPWWPHTHGTPRLYDIGVDIDGRRISLGRTGFRSVAIDRGADGRDFALIVNGERIFCRGAVWTNADLLRLPGDRDTYRPWLELARDGNMNMLRIGGTMVYETRDFFALCDELGILVWQDFQFANYDYPVSDPAFAEAVELEAEGFLGSTQGSPSLVVACGGSEIEQQAAMMGVSAEKWVGPLTQEILPQAVNRLRPDVAYVPNSPSGGAMPFSPDCGVAHYFGVSAYRQPIADARRANVKFATECLAFANVPEAATVEAHLPAGIGHDPAWKAKVPRDRGVGWDFEDIRDHYVELLYGVRPIDLRYGSPERYLDFGRAAVAEVMEAVFAEWRRTGSVCAGGIVWNFNDLEPGLGWGVIDALGRPKSAWFALRRAFRPVQLAFTSEGTNGLYAHLINDTGKTRQVRLEISCLRDGLQPVASGALDIDLDPRSSKAIAATDLFGAFFDTTYAFRFGPRSHDVTHGRLIDRETGETITEAFDFPQGRAAAMHPARLEARLEENTAGVFALAIATDRFAQSVHLDDQAFLPGDNWFHLAPGEEKRVLLKRRRESVADARPGGRIAVLGNPNSIIAY